MGAESELGYPTSGEVKIARGVYQQFQRGRIYWSAAEGACVSGVSVAEGIGAKECAF